MIDCASSAHGLLPAVLSWRRSFAEALCYGTYVIRGINRGSPDDLMILGHTFSICNGRFPRRVFYPALG